MGPAWTEKSWRWPARPIWAHDMSLWWEQAWRIKKFSVLGAGNTDPRDMANILRGISKARFEPARYGKSPVAVNMVWMVAHLTVRAKPSDQSSITPPRAGQGLGVSQQARPAGAISA